MQLPRRRLADDSPVARLYEKHAPALLAYLRRKARSREDAEDVLAQIFIAFIEASDVHYRSEKEQVAWLWQVAHHKAVDAYRRATVRQGLDLALFQDVIYEEEGQTPEQVSLRHEEYARLHLHLQSLPPAQREAVRLRFANGLHSAEIGQVLGKSEVAVRAMLTRTLNFLRKIYASDQGETNQ